MNLRKHRPTLQGKEVGNQNERSRRKKKGVSPEAAAVVAIVDRSRNDEMTRVKTRAIVEVDLESMEVHTKGIVVKVADIVHERAIKSVVMNHHQVPVSKTTLRQRRKRRKVDESLREKENAEVPETMMHVGHRTNKLVQGTKLKITKGRRQKESLKEDIQSNHEL